jgi:hypothetical protein
MREGMICQESKRGNRLPDGADAAQEHIGAIEITFQAQFAAELP